MTRTDLPTSMAAIGDSITRGVGADPTGYRVAPAYSWSTGDAGDGVVLSHYERLRALAPEIESHHHNLARGGARMCHAPRQARKAARLGVEYISVLMGANDLCTRAVGRMTPVDEFEHHFVATLEVIERQLPASLVYVVSIPDLHALWTALGDDVGVREIWRLSNACGSLLSPTATEMDRIRVRDRTYEYNDVLRAACERFSNCKFDDYAVHNHGYPREYLSLDFFHPSHLGQAQLAELTWIHGYWSS